MKKFSLILLFVLATISVNAQVIDTLSIHSKVFGDTRTIKVVLPKGYGQYSPDHPNKDREYMVVYLFDSQSASFFNFYKSTINFLTQQGSYYLYLHPVILVGISSPERQYEFTPKAQTAEGLKSFAKSGGADLLAMHLRDEVMPLIKSKYHVSAYNIGIGHSLGATFVAYSMLKFPDLFNAGIAISPNFHYDNEQIVHKFDSLANATTLSHKFLYLAYGYGDATEERFKPSTQKVGKLLAEKRIPDLKWQIKALDNDSHGLTGMEGIFKGLVAFNREFILSDDQITSFMADKNKPFIDHIKEYYGSISSWSGLKLPIVDDIDFITNGLADGHAKEAIEVLKYGITLYPDDSNLYDSVGEIALNMGDKATSLKYYSDGLEMVKKQKSNLDPAVYNRKITGFEKHIASIKN